MHGFAVRLLNPHRQNVRVETGVAIGAEAAPMTDSNPSVRLPFTQVVPQWPSSSIILISPISTCTELKISPRRPVPR